MIEIDLPLPVRSPHATSLKWGLPSTPPPRLSPTPSNQLSVFHPYNFVISTILHKWNQTARGLWSWPVFTWRNWELFKLLHVSAVGSFVVLFCGCTISFNHSPVGCSSLTCLFAPLCYEVLDIWIWITLPKHLSKNLILSRYSINMQLMSEWMRKQMPGPTLYLHNSPSTGFFPV